MTSEAILIMIGWDHGVFVPMLLIHPEAQVPIVQVSVLRSEIPTLHFRMGRALSSLRAQNIAIVSSGFASFHNLRYFGLQDPQLFEVQREWNDAVTSAAQTENLDEREKKFESWRMWPGAYDMHPNGGADHFLPLIVAAGAAGEGKGKAFKDGYRGFEMWSYYWD